MEKIEVGSVWRNSYHMCQVSKVKKGSIKFTDMENPSLWSSMDETTFLKVYRPLAKTDPVNHPPHYTSDPSGVECIQITRHRNFNIGNAIKYLWRAGLKDSEIQDLEKAVWYIQDEIKRLRGNE